MIIHSPLVGYISFTQQVTNHFISTHMSGHIYERVGNVPNGVLMFVL